MDNLIKAFWTPSFFIAGTVVIALCLVLTVARRRELGSGWRMILFFLSAASFGVILLGTIRELPTGLYLDRLGNWGGERLVIGRLEQDMMLNIALFVPFGLAATLFSRKPARVIAMAAATSFGVEVAQGLFGIGANDITDLVLNTLGAAIGAFVASIGLVIKDSVVARRLDTRRLFRLVIVAVIAVGVSLGLSIGGATAIQHSAADRLAEKFAGMNLADYVNNEEATDAKLQEWWYDYGMPRNDTYYPDSGNVRLRRYTWQFYGTTRCVTARWDADGFAAELGGGLQCAQPLRS